MTHLSEWSARSSDLSSSSRSASEWECQTLELLAARDPAVFNLLTDPELSLPRTL